MLLEVLFLCTGRIACAGVTNFFNFVVILSDQNLTKTALLSSEVFVPSHAGEKRPISQQSKQFALLGVCE